MRWAKATAGPLAVAAAYFLGSELGFALRFPPAMTSILWPPNAIVTAALVLTPPRRWWTLLAAVLPVHYLVQSRFDLPPALILALFCTNCLEALIGAGILHRFSVSPDRFDTLGRASLFLAAIMAAVLVSGFADAAAVSILRGEPYGRVWETRLLSNVLTSLALVPALVAAVRAVSRFPSKFRLRRAIEAGALLALLITAGRTAFAHALGMPSPSVRWLEQSELLLLLPLLLWAATRFGAAGSSFAILTTALIAFAFVTQNQVASTAGQSALAVRGLQGFLLVTGMPLFVLGALMEERRASERALAERLHFEELMSRLSGAFVHVPSNAMDVAFEEQLREVCDHFSLRVATLFQLAPEGGAFRVATSWSLPNPPRFAVPPAVSLPELFEHASRREVMRVEQEDGGWSLGLPLEAGDALLGTLVFVGTREENPDRPDLLPRLRLIGEVFANALARKESEDALRGGEAMKSAILASLPGQVAVLDRSGAIIAANQGWPARTAPSSDGEDGRAMTYAEACRCAPDSGLPATMDAAEGVQGVLAGARPSFTLEYPSRNVSGERWFALSVVPLRRPEGGAVAAHVDVTNRHRAEDEARRSREELAHFLRVSTVGELTTSLAHELNQPLTAILANAQAGRLLLDTNGGDRASLREILDDIVEEDKRAGEVIRRLRDLLRKGAPERAPLDLNRLAEDVTRLLANDAALRGVSIRLALNVAPVVVTGDRIQLQQVVLNLVMNAMDAMAESAPDQRIALVSTLVTPDGVHLSVRDSGTGLRESDAGRVFQPFYTTKPSGMGMGLSIARSIVEAHGGRIWGRDNAGSGATFTFSLPLSTAAPPP